MTENSQTPDNQENERYTVNAKTRRALLKGSAASLPVLLSFKSGAAMAMTSSERCIAHDEQLAETNKPAKFEDNNTDAFLRREVKWIKLRQAVDVAGQFRVELNTNGKPKSAQVYQPLSDTGDVYATTGNNQREVTAQGGANIDVYDAAGVAILYTGEKFLHQNGTVYVVETRRNRFGLVVTDNNGVALDDIFATGSIPSPRIGRFVDESNLDGQNHITESCWTSVNP